MVFQISQDWMNFSKLIMQSMSLGYIYQQKLMTHQTGTKVLLGSMGIPDYSSFPNFYQAFEP